MGAERRTISGRASETTGEKVRLWQSDDEWGKIKRTIERSRLISLVLVVILLGCFETC